jgi:hypothetical protein
VKQIPKGHELLSTPYAAVNCQLYGVKAVDDTWELAGETLFKQTNKQDIMGVVEYRTGGRLNNGSLKIKVTLMMGKKIGSGGAAEGGRGAPEEEGGQAGRRPRGHQDVEGRAGEGQACSREHVAHGRPG